MSSDTAIDSQIQVVLIDDDSHLRQALSQTLDLAGLKVMTLAEATGRAVEVMAGFAGRYGSHLQFR